MPANIFFNSASQVSGPAMTIVPSDQLDGGDSLRTVLGEIDSLAAGQQVVFQLDLHVGAESDGALLTFGPTFVGALDGSIDPDPANNALSTTVTALYPRADLAFALVSGPTGTVGVDSDQTFTYSITNNGPAAVQEVQYAIPMPANIFFNSASQVSGPAMTIVPSDQLDGGDSLRTVLGEIDSLAAGQQVVFQLDLHVGAESDGALLTFGPTFVGALDGSIDPDPANNAVSTTVTALYPRADLAFALVSGPTGTVGVDSDQTFTYSITNNGPAAVQEVQYAIPMPANIFFNSASQVSGPAMTIVPSDQLDGGDSLRTVLGEIDSLAAGQQVVFQLDLHVGAESDGALLTFGPTFVGALDGSIDPDPANNTVSTTVTALYPRADLAFAQVSGPTGPVAPGTDQTFTFSITNSGPADVQNGQYSLHLASNTTVVSASTVSGPAFTVTYNNLNGSFFVAGEIGPLASGAADVFQVVLHIDDDATDGSTLTVGFGFVQALDDTIDPNLANNSFTSTILVQYPCAEVTATDASGPYTDAPYQASGAAVGLDGHTAVSGSFTFSYYAGGSVSGTGSATPPQNVGTYTVVAHFVSSDATYASADSQPATFTITPVAATVSVTDNGGTFNGIPYGATATASGLGSDGVLASDGTPPMDAGTLSYTYYKVSNGQPDSTTASSSAPVTAGTWAVIAQYSSDKANYASNDSSDLTHALQFTIGQAAPTLAIVSAGGPYTGNQTVAVATVHGVVVGTDDQPEGQLEGVPPTLLYYPNSNNPLPPNYDPLLAPFQQGSYKVYATFAGSLDYQAVPLASASFVVFSIGQTTPTVTATDASGPYTGAPFQASGATVGADEQTAVSGSLTFTYYVGSTASGTGSATPPQNVGTYTVVAHFASSDNNYASADSQPTTFTITPVAPTVSVVDNGGTYGSARSFSIAVASVTGVGGDGVLARFDAGNSSNNLNPSTLSYTYYALDANNNLVLSTAETVAPTQAGNWAVVAHYAAPNGGNYVCADSMAADFTVAKETAVMLPISAPSVAYGQQAVVAVLAGYPSSKFFEIDTPGDFTTVDLTVDGKEIQTAPPETFDADLADNASAFEFFLFGLSVGDHAVTAVFHDAAGNHTDATETGTLHVNPATPTIAWANPADIPYGAALGSTQLDASASYLVASVAHPNGISTPVDGTFTYTPAAGTVLEGGANQTLRVSFTPADANHFTPASGSAAINVTPISPTVSASAVTLNYPTALADSQLSGTASFTLNDTTVNVLGGFTFGSLAGTILDPGSYTETVTFHPAPAYAADYASVSTQATVTVDQPPLITSAAYTTFRVGQAGVFAVTTDGFPTPVLTETGALPDGVTFNTDGTGTFKGTPKTAGVYPITLTAQNGVSPAATQIFFLDVGPTFTVNTATDDPAGPTPAAIAAGAVTLRDAINAVNADAGDSSASPDTINFALPGVPRTDLDGYSVQTVVLDGTVPLPAINNPALIDGQIPDGLVALNASGQQIVGHSAIMIERLAVTNGTFVVASGSLTVPKEGFFFTHGGTLQVNSGVDVNVQGYVDADEGGVIDDDGNFVLDGGSLNTFFAESGYDAGTVKVRSTLEIDNNSTNQTYGAVNDQGVVTVEAGGTICDHASVFIEDGTLNVNAAANGSPAGSVKVFAGSLWVLPRFTTAGGVVNDVGEIDVADGGVIQVVTTLNVTGGCLDVSAAANGNPAGSVIVSGTLNVGSNSNPQAYGYMEDDGSVTINAGGAIDDFSTFSIYGGTLQVTAAANGAAAGSVTVKNGGTLSVYNSGLIDDQGSITVYAGSNVEDAATFNVNGGTLTTYAGYSTWVLQNGAYVWTAISGGSVTVGYGVGTLSVFSSGSVDDQGRIFVYAGSNVYDYATFNVNGGSLTTYGGYYTGQWQNGVYVKTLVPGGSVTVEYGGALSVYNFGSVDDQGSIVVTGGNINDYAAFNVDGGQLTLNASGNYWVFQPDGSYVYTFVPAGSVTVGYGGALSVYGSGSVDDQDSIAVIGGNIYDYAAFNVDGGKLTVNASGDAWVLEPDGNYVYTSVPAGSVTVGYGGALSVYNSGSVDDQGSIAVIGGNINDYATVNVDGGKLTVNASGDAWVLEPGGYYLYTFVQAGSVTVGNGGALSVYGSGSVDDQGGIVVTGGNIADYAAFNVDGGKLTVNTSGYYWVLQPDGNYVYIFVQAGSVTVGNGGTLSVYGSGSVDDQGSIAVPGGYIDDYATVNVDGGKLTVNASGDAWVLEPGGYYLYTFVQAGSVTVGNGGTLSVYGSGSVDDQGGIVVTGGNIADYAAFNVDGGKLTVNTSGYYWVLQPDGNYVYIFVQAGSVTVGNGGTLSVYGSGSVDDQGSIAVPGGYIDDYATVNVDGGKLTVNASGDAWVLEPGGYYLYTFVQAGSVTVGNGGTLSVYGSGSVDDQGGIVVTGGNIADYAAFNVDGGKLTVNTSGYYWVLQPDGNYVYIFVQAGSVTVENGGALSVSSGSVDDYGSITVKLKGNVYDSSSFSVNGGTLTLDPGYATGFFQGVPGGNVTVEKGGSLTVDSNGTVDDQGAVTVNAGGNVYDNAFFSVDGGGLVLGGKVTVGAGGSLFDAGFVSDYGSVLVDLNGKAEVAYGGVFYLSGVLQVNGARNYNGLFQIDYGGELMQVAGGTVFMQGVFINNGLYDPPPNTPITVGGNGLLYIGSTGAMTVENLLVTDNAVVEVAGLLYGPPGSVVMVEDNGRIIILPGGQVDLQGVVIGEGFPFGLSLGTGAAATTDPSVTFLSAEQFGGALAAGADEGGEGATSFLVTGGTASLPAATPVGGGDTGNENQADDGWWQWLGEAGGWLKQWLGRADHEPPVRSNLAPARDEAVIDVVLADFVPGNRLPADVVAGFVQSDRTAAAWSAGRPLASPASANLADASTRAPAWSSRTQSPSWAVLAALTAHSPAHRRGRDQRQLLTPRPRRSGGGW